MTIDDRSVAAIMIASFLIVSGSALVLTVTMDDKSSESMSRFSSYSQLRDFIGTGETNGGAYYDSPDLSERQSSTGLQDHSSTNIQVSGVDESDIVKTDGEFIFTASGSCVTIIKAFPPSEMSVVTQLSLAQFVAQENSSIYVTGLFLSGNNLAVVLNEYSYYYYLSLSAETNTTGPRTALLVFNVEDPQEPVLRFSAEVSGYDQAERMIGPVVYIVSQSYAWLSSDDEVSIPAIWKNNESSPLAPQDIYYDPETKGADSFVNILAVNIETSEFEAESIVSGYASTIYMSQSALYMTYQKWTGESIPIGTVRTLSIDSLRTSIYRIAVDGLSMSVEARGDVGGWLLNQFSMDESNGYLRVATTTEWSNISNSVYVLDGDLQIVGDLLSIAPGERIFSARFVDDTLYLVTFRQIDPLFVIDLSVPSNPTVLGELTMPGFSSYLHPVDSDHLLGIGSENSSVKVSLYDVSDPTNPLEESRYVIPGYSYSEAQYDHKAILFDLQMNLLVVPVNSWDYYGSGNPSGAYVFDVSLTEGIGLKGVVQHDLENQNDSGFWYSSDIRRSLYIGDYLYTIGMTSVKASSLADLSAAGFVTFEVPYQYYYGVRVDTLVNSG